MHLSCKPMINVGYEYLVFVYLAIQLLILAPLMQEQPWNHQIHTNWYLKLVMHTWYRINKEIMKCGANSLGKTKSWSPLGCSVLLWLISTLAQYLKLALCGDLPWWSLQSHWEDKIHTPENIPYIFFPPTSCQKDFKAER